MVLMVVPQQAATTMTRFMVPADELGTTMLGAGRCVTPAIRKEMPQAITWVEAWLSHC